MNSPSMIRWQVTPLLSTEFAGGDVLILPAPSDPYAPERSHSHYEDRGSLDSEGQHLEPGRREVEEPGAKEVGGVGQGVHGANHADRFGSFVGDGVEDG